MIINNRINGNSFWICTFGNPILRKKSKPVTLFDAHLKTFSKQMTDMMYATGGIGIAAPQMGHLLQLIVIDLQGNENGMVILDDRNLPLAVIQPFVFVNPNFLPVNEIQTDKEEGCLSLPGIHGVVKRFYEIILSYQDLEGNKHTLRCNDLFARCIQHECDHLNGILFIDRISKMERHEQQSALNKIKALGGQFNYAETVKANENTSEGEI